MYKYHAFKDIPELVKELQAVRERFRDSLEPQGDIRMVVERDGDVRRAMLRVGADDAAGLFGLKGYVHSQLSERLFKKGGAYYQRLLREAPELLATNVNHWLQADEKRRRLLRFDGLDVRAFLSDRFRIIDNFDILTTAVQVITGQDGESGEKHPYARGARCFNWALNDKRMNVCLVNPAMVVDLKNPDKGIMRGVWDETALRAGEHAWLKPAPEHGDDGGHYVCPSAKIGNSETGHGGANVNPGFLESGCVNMAWLQQNLAQVHVGRVLKEDDLMSDETRKKENALIFAKVADAVRAVFDPELLLKNVRKFAGLADELVDRKEAINRIAKLPGITEEIRDDILSAYAPMKAGTDTLLDVQRAVTNAAHAVRTRDEEQALELETLGGAIVERGMAALTA
jgi:hypothetical protein